MSNGLEFDIKANANDAVKGFQRVEAELGKMSKAATQAAQALPKLAKNTAQANVSLVNFGRVIQDAPFGLIGMANNIDPLISSLQNLGREAKQNGTSALKELGKALIGPAGVALAVSAVTSAFIAFGPEIKKLVSGVTKLDLALQDAAKGSAEAFSKATNEFQAFVDTANDYTASTERQKDALDDANKQLAEYGLKVKDLTSFQKNGVQISAIYAELKREEARATILAAKAAEAYAKSVLLSTQLQQGDALGVFGQFSFGDKLKTLFGVGGNAAIEAAKGVGNAFVSLTEQEKAFNIESDLSKARVDALIKSMRDITGVVEDFGKKTKDTKQSVLETGAAIMGLSTAISDSMAASNLQRQSASKFFDPSKLQTPTTAPNGGIQQSQAQALAANEKLDFLIKSINFDKQIAQAAELQSIIDNGINAGIDQFFNALANNQNPFEAMIQGVKRLIVELVSAVAKALILQAISSGLSGGGSDLSAIAKRGGRASLLGGGVPGFATGGFVSQPTMATIAENGPEFVLRPDQLGAIMNMGSSNQMTPELRFRGEDLFIMFKRVQARYGRNY